MTRTDRYSRKRFAPLIQARFRKTYTGSHPDQACLYWAKTAIDVLSDLLGTRVIIQAGTCSWPRVTPEQDDGVSPTHMTYQWDQTAAWTISEGMMPEIHVWAAIPWRGEIVDMTTGFFPANCLRMLGMDWPGIKPPEVFWGTAEELPDGVVYKPDIQAIGLALAVLRQDLAPHKHVLR